MPLLARAPVIMLTMPRRRRALADAIVVSVHRAARLAEAAVGTEGAAGGAAAQGGQAQEGAAVPTFGSADGRHMELGEDWGAEAIVQVGQRARCFLHYVSDNICTALLQALSTLSADLSLLHSHLPELALKDRATATVSGCIERHLTTSFAALSSRVMGGVLAVRSRLESAAGDHAHASQSGSHLILMVVS